MNVKYKNPPIDELIIGLYFDQPILPLRSEYVGLFWSEIRKEFPKIQQQVELSLPLLRPSLTFQVGLTDELYPMPRFWLISEDDTFLIQIQKNAFILNWRRRKTEYPHFDNVKSSFDAYFLLYLSFLRRELGVDTVNIQIAELTYSNVIESGEYWTGPNDTPRIIPRLSIPDPGIPVEGEPDFNYLTAYKLASDLALNVAVRTGRKASEAGKAVLVLELRALGALGAVNKVDADAWFNRSHAAIGHCFTAITNPDIQLQHWQPV